MELDAAYNNSDHIPGAAEYPQHWASQAARFRDRHPPVTLPYGPSPRQAIDLFRPDGQVKGTVVFIHGGFWLRFGRRDWSHLAAGPLAHGWAVALPSYELCPAVRIAQITGQMAAALGVIARTVPGELRLAGHSAGGHLVARLAGQKADWSGRLAHVMPISPLADLAPLMRTTMNADLQIDAAEARAESPVHQPRPAVPVTLWVGAQERPAFLEQARGLARAWAASHIVEPDRHHFDVIDGLCDPESALVQRLLSASA